MQSFKNNPIDPKEKQAIKSESWRHGPKFLDPLIRLGDPTMKRITPFVKTGQVVADLGCGWGHDAFALADLVGPKGKVFAVDLDPKCIQAIQIKAAKVGRQNIEACETSASDIGFIAGKSVDFVLTNGLLCSMAYDRPAAVKEIQRILKPTGRAYLNLGSGPPLGFVDKAEWEEIMAGFTVELGGSYKEKWAIVSVKQGGI